MTRELFPSEKNEKNKQTKKIKLPTPVSKTKCMIIYFDPHHTNRAKLSYQEIPGSNPGQDLTPLRPRHYI
jgi:hypothetical protein